MEKIKTAALWIALFALGMCGHPNALSASDASGPDLPVQGSCPAPNGGSVNGGCSAGQEIRCLFTTPYFSCVTPPSVRKHTPNDGPMGSASEHAFGQPSADTTQQIQHAVQSAKARDGRYSAPPKPGFGNGRFYYFFNAETRSWMKVSPCPAGDNFCIPSDAPPAFIVPTGNPKSPYRVYNGCPKGWYARKDDVPRTGDFRCLPRSPSPSN